MGQEGADFVKRLQPHALRLDVAGLGLDLGCQPLIERLKRFGHAVETGRHLTELVLGINVDARRELPGLHLGKTLPESAQGADHVQMAGVEHDNRPADGQRHHRELEQIENGGQPGQMPLNGEHEAVNGFDKITRRLK